MNIGGVEAKLPNNARVERDKKPRWSDADCVIRIKVGEYALYYDVVRFKHTGFYGYNKYGDYAFRTWESLPDLSYLERNYV